MAKRSRVITMASLDLDEQDDLSLWEFVNPSDAAYSDDSLSVDSLPEDVISLESEAKSESEPEPEPLPEPSLPHSPQPLAEGDGGDRTTDPNDIGGHIDIDRVIGGVNPGFRISRQVLLHSDDDLAYFSANVFGKYGCGFVDDGGDEEHGDDEVVDDDGDDDDYDLDDELVPLSVSKKLGRQRMRKLGKRVFSKVVTSKHSPYTHLKPGCVRGKHGLGMKFKC